jgi:methylmalonyl-CoA mutase cobalamin-binding subunit
VPFLEEAGISRVFGPGASTADIVGYIRANARLNAQ